MNKLVIIETVSKFAYHADNREWAALQQLFTEEVTVDYTSLVGGVTPEQSALGSFFILSCFQTESTLFSTS